MSQSASPAAGDRSSADQAIESLEAQLRNTPRTTRPYEHAAISFRLGLAYAESPAGGADTLRKALACYDVAAAIFDPRFSPVEHARVLNVAGAAQRALGDRQRAAKLFEEASALLDGRDRDGERAAALNNLGLVRTELGQPAAAVEAFDLAVDLFDTTSAEGKRGRVATILNRGQAHSAEGTVEGLEAALADFEDARTDLDPEDAPYHHALLQHSVGVTCSALAGLLTDSETGPERPPGAGSEERRRFLQEAVRAFQGSLEVFTRSGFPYQHALARHNLGLACVALGGVTNQRRAQTSFEDSVAILDRRLHADAWRQAYASLQTVEKELEASFPGWTRSDHFAALVADVAAEERDALVRDRMSRLMATPETLPRIGELARSAAKLGAEAGVPLLEAQINILIELPMESQSDGLTAVYKGVSGLPAEFLDEGNVALDKAVSLALEGPQRVYVRDFFSALGWERP